MASPLTRALRLPILLVLALAAGVSTARAVEERAWVSLGAGGVFYDPEQGVKDNVGYDARAAYFLNRWVGVEGLYFYAHPSVEDPYVGKSTFTHFGGGLIFTPDRFRWTLPYIYGGFGSAKLDIALPDTKSNSAIHAGVGVLARAGERLGFRLDGRGITYNQVGGLGRDTRVSDFIFSGSVTALWGGRPRDTDEDGVPDKNDRSPNTPRGAIVDATGTPLDTDKDGVYDGLDKEPATPLGAKVDGSGIAVDSDKDGVPDGIDQCAFTPAGAAVNAGGCPITLSPVERQLTGEWMVRLTDLEFPPDSSVLRPQAMARLDSVAVALLQWPTVKVEIGVHVDDTPEPGYRIPLSQMRARAVLQYLFRTYPKLNAKNYWITGYGDTDPLVPNTSSANRAINRRVDFRVMNMNVLYHEKARRESFGSTPVPPAPGLEPKMPPPPEGQAPPAPEGGTPETPPDKK